MEIIRWGILGCGKIASKFAEDLSAVSGCKINAVASTDIERAKGFANATNAPHYFDSYEKMLSVDFVDVVYIATPHTFHAAHAEMCLNAGISVLCEKPIAVSVRQLKRIQELAIRKNLFLAEALWTAHLPNIKNLLTHLTEGIIGEVKHIVADFSFQSLYDENSRLFNPQLAGGSLLDIGIYPLAICQLILGKPTLIRATGELTNSGVDIRTSISTFYESGATASLFCALDMHSDTSCTIYGTKGKIIIPGRFHEQDHYYIYTEDESPVKIQSGRIGRGFTYEIIDTNNCLRNRYLQSEVMPLQFSLDLIASMDEIRKQINVIYPFEK
ncbi:MAG: Gfo/Idh/MocA family oxidoreductase [Saprospiraceae bacterium]|nr:Gfo/Idh/MocA family oxidoreductase [Saprospiraceae bacterium]